MSTTYPDVDATNQEFPMPAQIHSAMLAVMRATTAIGKDQTNTQQNFKFRGIDQIYNRLHSLMAEHGVYTTSEVLNVERHEKANRNGGVLLYTIATFRYWFHAEDGSKVSTEVIGEGMDSGDKATNKAMAIAHKYALLQALMIPTEDMVDPDSESPQIAAPSYSDKQKRAFDAMLAAGDSLGIALLEQSSSAQQWTDLYNSGERGQKVKIKQAADALHKEGKTTMQYINEAIAKNDSLMAREAMDGALAGTVAMAKNHWPELSELLESHESAE